MLQENYLEMMSFAWFIQENHLEMVSFVWFITGKFF